MPAQWPVMALTSAAATRSVPDSAGRIDGLWEAELWEGSVAVQPVA